MRSKMKRTITEAQSLNIKFTRPLDDFKYPFFGYLLTLYNRYSDGILPFTGGLADQPAQIVELFNTLESLELEFKQQEAEAQERRAKRKK